jgi:hypothetical protein
MLNEYKHQVLEERLQILNVLEAFITRAPDRDYYVEMLSDFGLSISSDSMTAHLSEIAKHGVAKFELPSGLTKWTFWDARVRIRDIDPTKLQAAQQSLRDELSNSSDRRSSHSADGIGGDGEDSRELPDNSVQDPISSTEPKPKGLPLFVGILGFIATVVTIVVTVGSWQLLKTGFVRAAAVIGLVILAAVLTRLTLRLRDGELPWRVTIDITTVGVLCVCGTLVFAAVLNRQTGKAAAGDAVSKPTAASINLEFDITDSSRVPWCQIYYGTGTIPTGDVLAIFSTQANSDGLPTSPPYYSFDGDAQHPVAGHWQTVPLQVGSPGQANFPADIVGVLTNTAAYDYIASIIIKDNAQWWTTELPPGPRISLSVVTNGERGMTCQAVMVK